MKNNIKRILKEYINENQQRFFLIKFNPKDDFEPGTAVMDQTDWVTFIDGIHDNGGSIKSLTQSEYINLSGSLTDENAKEIEDISDIFGDDYEAIYLLKQIMKKYKHEIDFINNFIVITFKYEEKLYSYLDRIFKLWNKHNKVEEVVVKHNNEIWVVVPKSWLRFVE